MFLVKDTIQKRHQMIRSFLDKEPAIAVLLAAADFEWTVRRAILACGSSSIKDLRQRKLNGPFAYAACWKTEVTPRFHKTLQTVIRDWELFRRAFQLRHKLIHGIQGTTGRDYACRQVEIIISASNSIVEFAAINRAQVYGVRIRRVKSRF
jgi:hypothetical protein